MRVLRQYIARAAPKPAQPKRPTATDSAEIPREVRVLIKRPESEPRLLPLITPDMYTAAVTVSTVEATPGQFLLALYSRPLRFRQRVLGLSLSGENHLIRLLWFHAQGLAAECTGQERRATYFWGRALDELRSMWDQPSCWQTTQAEGADLRRRVLDELFIDTHCAFYNGYIAGKQPLDSESRAFYHADQILALTQLPGLDEMRYLDIVEPIHEARAIIYEAYQQPQRAVKHREELVRLFPQREDRLDQLVNARFRAALADLSAGATPATCRADAEKLRIAIDSMEAHRRETPHSLSYYNALAHLCHLRAVRLGNALAPSEALVAAQQALTYNPRLKQAHTTRRELRQLLERLTQQIRNVEKQLAGKGKLNEQQIRIRKDVQRGLTSLKYYTESAQAKQIVEQRTAAHTRAIWQRLNLPVPTDHFDERTEVLMQAVATLQNLEPYNAQQALKTWSDLVAESAYLVDLDPGPILLFVHRYRTGEDNPATQPAPGFAIPDDPPRIAPAPCAARQQDEPIDLWLFSLRDMRLKLLATTAACLLLLAGILTFVDTSNQAARDRAYAQVLAATQANDQLSLMDAAADFLAHPALNGRDPRNGQVRDLYAETFVHWFVALDETNSASVQSRVSQYRALVGRD